MQTKLRKHFFFQKRAIKAQKPAKIDFPPKNSAADQNSLTLVKPGSVQQTIQISFKK